MAILHLITLICVSIFVQNVNAGCAELRLCCAGRNMSCIALDTGPHKSNDLHPIREPISAEARRRNGKTGGAWHVHFGQGTDLNSFDGALNNGDRFFESLFAPVANLADRQGGDGEKDRKSENVRLSKEDYDELQQIPASTTGSSVNETGSGENMDYGSGEDFSNVDFLGSNEDLKSNEEKKIDNVEIDENMQYQVMTAEHKAGDPVEIRYVIENDELPVTLEQLEMLQNFRSLVGGVDRACYCDEACRVLGDCCSDYKFVCPVIDCLVTEWTGWTPCEASGHHAKYVSIPDHQNYCGLGISRRQRQVIRAAMHGGKPCPILEEQKTCYSIDTPQCQKIHAAEIAHLIPYEYGRARVPGYKNNSAGIFYDLPRDIAKFNSGKTYCITYEITWLNPACTNDQLRQNLNVGREICMECQPMAQNPNGNRCVGEGAENQRSTWNIVSVEKHCYGFWKRQEKKGEICKCDSEYPHISRYLFV